MSPVPSPFSNESMFSFSHTEPSQNGFSFDLNNSNYDQQVQNQPTQPPQSLDNYNQNIDDNLLSSSSFIVPDSVNNNNNNTIFNKFVSNNDTNNTTLNTKTNTTNSSSKEGVVSWRQRPRRVIHACSTCRRAHRRCDKQRPCSRCIKLGHQEICAKEEYSIPAKKRRKPQSSSKRKNKTTKSQPQFVFQNMYNPFKKQNQEKQEKEKRPQQQKQQGHSNIQFKKDTGKRSSSSNTTTDHLGKSPFVFKGYLSRKKDEHDQKETNTTQISQKFQDNESVALYNAGIQTPNSVEELQEDHTLMLCLAHLKASFPDITNTVENILQQQHPQFRITNEMLFNALKCYQSIGNSVCLDRKKNYIAGSRSSAVLSTQTSSPYLLSWGKALERQWGMTKQEIASTPWTNFVHLQSAEVLTHKRSSMKELLALDKSIVFMKPVRVLAQDKNYNFFEVVVQTTAICKSPGQIWFFTVCWW